MQIKDSVLRVLVMPWLACISLIASVCLICGCGGGATSTPTQIQQSAELPSLGELELQPAAGRRTSYVEADLVHVGAAFDNTIANNLVSPDGDIGTFQPDHPGGAIGHGLAFCIYRFDIPGYDRNAQIRMDWQTPPAAGSLYVALANWETLRWQWFAADPAAPLNLPAITPFIRDDGTPFDDTLLCAVLCTGTGNSELATIRVGSQAPVIGFNGSTASLTGFVPVSGTIDISPSTDPDGEIVKFEWDLDGDGSFETDSGLDAVRQIEQTEAGGFYVGIRATDNDGVSTVRQVAVRGYAEWRHSWGGGGFDSFWGSAFDGVGSIYALGSTDSYGAGDSDVLLVRFDLAGDIVWQKTWGTTAGETGWDLDIDADGNLVVLAKTEDTGATLLKFSPEGAVIWARRYAPLSAKFAGTAMAISGTDIYFCGYNNTTGQTNPGFIARIDSNGDPVWFRKWENGAIRFTGIQVYRPTNFTPVVAVCGSRDGDVLVLALETDGSFYYAETWGGTDSEEASDLFAVGPFNPELWVCATLTEGDRRKVLVLERRNSAPIARIWDAGSTDEDDDVPQGIVNGSDGNFYVSGWSSSFGAGSDGILLEFSKTGALQSSTGLHDLGNDILFNGELELLSGQALLFTGRADRADGTVWNPAPGTVSTVNREWNDIVNSVTTISVNSTVISGTLNDAAGAVIDSGGGGGSDAVIALRQAP